MLLCLRAERKGLSDDDDDDDDDGWWWWWWWWSMMVVIRREMLMKIKTPPVQQHDKGGLHRGRIIRNNPEMRDFWMDGWMDLLATACLLFEGVHASSARDPAEPRRVLVGVSPGSGLDALPPRRRLGFAPPSSK